jgi:hypothetical protein
VRALAGVLLALALATPLSAQFGYFGQNKIQYRRFDWRVLRGEHVDLYYYPEEEELGRVALAYAEASYDSLERRFNASRSSSMPHTRTSSRRTSSPSFLPRGCWGSRSS